ncbi:MAG: helix-turn-helix domain-containing protein [Candidatus Peribacteraceae bacterium]|jgi:sugar-specific transcriptional regulator TrmB|nr:hypothetical protein [bacterium]MDP6561443.1 helix-turn-helix domain-containing protein [Candidatus Peribacteraceae bacterium]|tara:strand:- start:17314 stop:18147 length:834 start_codon:yes stop_codon:yes gene_type:complete
MGTAALKHVIQSVGLDTEEAALYIAGLKLGSAPASDYGKKAGFNRITTYNHLEKLTKRGIFSVVRKRNIKYYQPISPEKLSIEARKNVEALDRVLPDLRGLMGNHHRTPRVRYFEGADGIRDIYRDTLTAETDLLNFANSSIVRNFWKEYDKQYVQERVKKGIHLKGVAPDDETGRKVQGKDKESFREIRLVSVKEFPINNEINIYDNKVAIISFAEDESEVFGVIIESKEVADTQRQIFEMAWRYAALGEGARRKEKIDTEEGVAKVRKDQLIMFE